MPNQSLVDLTERTATADSDLIHVNSGGSDYKQTKANFLQGDLYHVFDNTSLLTTQIDALPNMGTFFGRIASFGAQTVTGVPVNSNGDVFVQKFNGNYVVVDFHPIGNSDATYRKCKSGGTWESSWTQLPSRSEITSLNNSLTQCLTTTPVIITSGKDLNDYKSNGLYIVQSGVTNAPSSWCALLVIGAQTTYGAHQLAFSFSAFYVRSCTGSPMAWTNWRSLTFS